MTADTVSTRYRRARPDGAGGLCYLRQHPGGELKLVSLGRSSGLCVDPAEKKPLNHDYPGSAALSFATAGCNLAGKLCQNWGMSKSRQVDTLADAAARTGVARAVIAGN